MISRLLTARGVAIAAALSFATGSVAGSWTYSRFVAASKVDQLQAELETSRKAFRSARTGTRSLEALRDSLSATLAAARARASADTLSRQTELERLRAETSRLSGVCLDEPDSDRLRDLRADAYAASGLPIAPRQPDAGKAPVAGRADDLPDN